MKLTKEEKRKIKERIKFFHPLFFRVEKIEVKKTSVARVSVKPVVSFFIAILIAPFILIFMIFSTIIDFLKTLPVELRDFGSMSKIKTTVFLKDEETLSNEEMVKLKEKLR